MGLASHDHEPGLKKVIFHAVKLICTPLARFCVRFKVPMNSVVTILRSCFIEAARSEGASGGRSPNDSTVQVMTGIPRKLIPAIENTDPLQGFEPSTLAKMLGIWTTDKRYIDELGRPLELPIRAIGSTPSFGQLVKEHCPDFGVRPVLNCLEKDGNVEITDYGCVRLINSMVGATSADSTRVVTYVSRSIAHLFNTALHNLDAIKHGKKRIYERRRLSRHIPSGAQERVSKEITRVFEKAEADIDKILSEAEVSPDSIDLVTQGAGFYEFRGGD